MNSKRPKTWLITGVSTGLGRCLMNAALDRGDIVVGTLRNMALKEEIEARAPGRAFIVPLDVDHADRAVPAVEDAVRLLGGRLDGLGHQADFGSFGSLEQLGADATPRLMETHFFGLRRVTGATRHSAAWGRRGAVR